MDALARLLKEHRRSGAYRSKVPPAGLDAAAQALEFAFYRLVAEGVCTKSAMLRLIARVLSFPAWSGRNWDALEDCLTDLSWIDAPGIVIEIESFSSFAKADPEGFGTLLDIFKTAAEYWRSEGKAFWVIFTGKPAAGLDLPSLSA